MRNPQNPQPNEDFSLKITSPKIPAKRGSVFSAFGLVEEMHYLYVRIVRAKDLFFEPTPDAVYDSFMEVRLGNYKGITKVEHGTPNPEWNQVFAFSKDRIYSSFLDIILRKKGCDDESESFRGRVVFDVNEAPKRVPPDSPLAPQWYKLEAHPQQSVTGHVMAAVWLGTQADEAFPEAWHSDAAGISPDSLMNTRSKVYLSPKLWYLRVNVIQAQDLEVKDSNNGFSPTPQVFVKGALGNVVMKTKFSQSGNLNPIWNEDMLFVAAEPFEHQLILSVEEKEEVLGKCMIQLKMLERRFVSKPVDARWYCLESESEEESRRLNSKILLRVCLDGGYHVLDESTHYSSDLRPTVKQLWKPRIGALELGILNAKGLPPMKRRDGRGATDAYCVAKYGEKWVRTRTIVDSSSPRWNEQYTWQVFDPCTVVTVGVFDNCHLEDNQGGRDSNIGRLRIRLSTLEADKIYTCSYPLVVVQPQGVKKMGEIELAIRFTCTSFFNLIQSYSQPILPKMHYLSPLSIYQLDYLRYQATQVLSLRLARSEPPLGKEVVQYMLDVGSQKWSTRRCRANCQRIRRVCSNIGGVIELFDRVCSWEKPYITVFVHVVVLVQIVYPRFILPSLLLCLFGVCAWKYTVRPKNPPCVDVELSYADKARLDELDEEFDSFPSCKDADVVKMRYDRMRGIGGRVQTVVADLATQCERVESLVNWRDTRASGLFAGLCLCGCVVLYFTPFKLIAVAGVFYGFRHPMLRNQVPSMPVNFFRRLPARTDCLI